MNYFNFLNDDVVEIVCSHLLIKDTYNLLKIYDSSEGLLYRIIIKKILNNLKDKFSHDDYNHIINFMKNTNCCISGSYLLQCIINKEYNTDVDFFVSSKYLDDVKKLIKDLDIENSIDINYSRYERDIFKVNFEVMTRYYSNNKNINTEILNELNKIDVDPSEYDFENSKKLKLQFILLELDDPAEHIKNNFDLDIIRNYLTYEYNKFNLYIENIDNIVNNIMDIKLKYNDERLKTERIIKYINRGFKFNSASNLNYIQLLLNNNIVYIASDGKIINLKTSKKCKPEGTQVSCNENCYIINFFKEEFKHIHFVKYNKHARSIFNGNYFSDNKHYISETDIIVYTDESVHF